MEERLFSAGRVDKLKHQHKQQQGEAVKTTYSDLPHRCNQSLTTAEHPNPNFYPEPLEISQLREKEGSEEEDECMDTIRRMKEMMDLRESLPEHPFPRQNMKENCDFGNKSKPGLEFSTVQKLNHPHHHADSDAEIDFSLTINHSLSAEREAPPKWALT
jgi:hypothetical protein